MDWCCEVQLRMDINALCDEHCGAYAITTTFD
jgi:hypothetical protein